MIIWIASYPRSGNTYMQMLLWHFYGFSPYSVYLEKELAKGEHIKKKMQEFWGHIPALLDLTTMAKSSEWYFVKTHEMPHDHFPAIYLVRDGRDAIISYAHFIRNFENSNVDIETLLYNLISTSDSFGGWNAHVLHWTQRQEPTVIIKFEDLIQHPEPLQLVTQTLRTVGCQSFVSSTTSFPTFAELHQKYPRFFHKGQIGRWREELPHKLHELFWKKHKEGMVRMGYHRISRLSPACED